MRLFSNVWSENTALFERLMEIHSNSPKLYDGFNVGEFWNVYLITCFIHLFSYSLIFFSSFIYLFIYLFRIYSPFSYPFIYLFLIIYLFIHSFHSLSYFYFIHYLIDRLTSKAKRSYIHVANICLSDLYRKRCCMKKIQQTKLRHQNILCSPCKVEK